MKHLRNIAIVMVLLMPAAASADDTRASRSRAAEETREALKAYGESLEKELQQLEDWVETATPPGGEQLRDERALAKQKLEQLTDEAQRTWSSIRTRMEDVVDDLKRKHGEARTNAKP